MIELWIAVGVALLVALIVYIYRKTRRISHIEDLPGNYVGMMLSGIATGVSDGDGFRFFHTPWLRRTKHTSRDSKLYVRLAGIDAPEMRHSQIPEQPFAKESKEYLRILLLGKKVNIKIVGIDRYNRVLAIAYLPGWFFSTNVNLDMVKKGYACVYTGKDAIYDEYEEALKKLEEEAERNKRGLWNQSDVVTPMEYKKMYR